MKIEPCDHQHGYNSSCLVFSCVRLMAKYADLSCWQVRQIWAAADLKPHRLKTFKISNDPDFAEKVIDAVGYGK